MAQDLKDQLSPKTAVATAGAGVGAITTAVVLWVVGATLFGGSWSSDAAVDTIAAVPTPLSAFLGLLITTALAFVPSWIVTDPAREADPSAGELSAARAERDQALVRLTGAVTELHSIRRRLDDALAEQDTEQQSGAGEPVLASDEPREAVVARG